MRDSRGTSGRGLRLTIAGLVAAALCLATVPYAAADGDHAFPSRQQVDEAQARADQKARDVGAIRASLLLANQRLEQAAVRAEQAAEAYNGAMWRLRQARQDVRAARAEATRARRTVARQRDAIAALVADSYQHGSELTALSAMMSADGPEGVLDQYAAFQGASTSLDADLDRFAAADALAQVFEDKAVRAREKQRDLAARARAARDAATSAANQAQATADRIAREKDRLVRELADAQHISVQMARQRQTALEEIARERAEARARREAAAAARAQARAEARARREARARAEAAADRAADQDRPDPTPDAAADPAPSPSPGPAPSRRGGARRAIAFAKAQLGEWYQWGAAGPDRWDCSGLTMGAWGAAGVYLPHYSVAQYETGTPISPSRLRPGDLVFWGTTSDPASIHHVAMYLGGGMIIHAPRTGRPVEIDSMYYWIPPNFFARV